MPALTLKIKWIRVYQFLEPARAAFEQQRAAAAVQSPAWEFEALRSDRLRTTDVTQMDIYDVDRSPRMCPFFSFLYAPAEAHLRLFEVPTRAKIQAELMEEETVQHWKDTRGRVRWLVAGLKIEEKKYVF